MVLLGHGGVPEQRGGLFREVELAGIGTAGTWWSERWSLVLGHGGVALIERWSP